MSEINRQQWASVVATTLADHPEWVAITVEAMQAGVVVALERQQDRISDISLGLVEALNTRPGTKRRNGERIVQAIQATNYHPTQWATDAIARERKQ